MLTERPSCHLGEGVGGSLSMGLRPLAFFFSFKTTGGSHSFPGAFETNLFLPFPRRGPGVIWGLGLLLLQKQRLDRLGPCDRERTTGAQALRGVCGNPLCMHRGLVGAQLLYFHSLHFRHLHFVFYVVF